MAENADYTISATIVAKDATGHGAKEAERNLVRVEERATAAGLGIGRLFALIGGAAGLGSAVRSIIGINSAIQDTTNGLATLYSAMTGADIGSSFRAAQSDIAGLREDARKGVGELSDYTDAFQRVLAPGLAAGASRAALRDLTRNSIAAAGAAGRPLWQAGGDLQQALTTGAHQRTTPIVSLALAAAGISEVKFNAESAAKRIEDMNRAFATFGPGVALMGKSWNAQLSTFTDNIKSVVGTIGKPLFDRWTRDLTAVNGWIDKNRDRLAEIAETWGAKLIKVWDSLISRAGIYAGILAAANLTPGLVGMGRSAVGAAGAGVARSGIGAALRDPLGMMAAMGVEGATPGLAPVLGGILSAATKAAPPLAIVGTLIAAVGVAARNGGPAVDYALAAWGRLAGAFTSLGVVLDVLDAKGGALDLTGQALIGALGLAADAMSPLVKGLGSLAIGFGVVMNVIADGFRAIYLTATGDLAGASRISVVGRLTEANKALGTLWGGETTAGGKPIGPKTGDLPPVTKHGDNVFNGPVTVNVKTEINSDPARVVDTWHKGMDRIRQAAVQAQRVPALSGA